MNKIKFYKRDETNYIVVHCSATPPEMDIGVKDIRNWHTRQGWLDVGYHYVIRRNGEIESGRPQGVIGAHCRPVNRESIGVCLVGGYDSEKNVKLRRPQDNFTTEQKASLGLLLNQLLTEYPEAAVRGHRDFKGVHKACPSFDVQTWWRDYEPIVQSIMEPQYNE